MAANPKKSALGRGLSVLLSPQDQDILQTAVQEGLVSVDLIDINPFQPRDQFDPEALEQLRASIEQLGIIQPLTLRRNGSRYQLISGERRLRAARLLGKKDVPAYIIDTTKQGMIEMALVENLQRKDLNPIEIGLGLLRLQEECSLNQDQVAQRVGMSRVNVSHYTRLVKLPPEIQGAAYQSVQNQLVRHFESPVRMQVGSSGKGEIRIPFSDTNDLNRLLDLIFERD